MSRNVDRLAVAALAAGVALLLFVVLRGGDGAESWRFPDVAGTDYSIGGVVRMDDVAIGGAEVQLGIAEGFFATDESKGVTNADGSFVLELPDTLVLDDPSARLFLQVSVEGAEIGGDHTAPVQLRRPVNPGSMTHDISVPEIGACATSASSCELQLPDLAPVTTGATLAGDELLPAESVRIDTETMPGRSLLRFSTLTANIGEGPLHVLATGEEIDGSTPTIQRVWRGDLAFDDRMAGVFVFHPGHDHIHVEDFERYRLLEKDGQVVRTADKISYCLRDSARLDEFEPADAPYGVYLGIECGSAAQAINPGYADYYGAELADQWIDVTGVAAGEYLVEIAVDPSNFIAEQDESNNVVTFPVTLPPLG